MAQHQHINASGFPLQLALAQAVRDELQDWKVIYQEHAWKTADESGFIDLVIEWELPIWVMNIECKRVRDTEWTFLRNCKETHNPRRTKLWISYFASQGERSHFAWRDISMDPRCMESNMCVVPGQDGKSAPMLERIANTVVSSTEALAVEEAGLLKGAYEGLRMYMNVIVTTAKLSVCNIDLAKISLTTGEIDPNSEIISVPWVRFQKQVGATLQQTTPQIIQISTLSDISRLRESTVFVVNADHFVEFVTQCSYDNYSVDNLRKSF
jgi:hypothetical protein